VRNGDPYIFIGEAIVGQGSELPREMRLKKTSPLGNGKSGPFFVGGAPGERIQQNRNEKKELWNGVHLSTMRGVG